MATIPYIWSENTTNPYEHYNTEKVNPLKKQQKYILNTEIAHWENKKASLESIVSPSFLNDSYNTDLGIKFNTIINNIPGSKKIHIFSDGQGNSMSSTQEPFHVNFIPNTTFYKSIRNFLKDYDENWSSFIITLTITWYEENTNIPLNYPPLSEIKDDIKEATVILLNPKYFEKKALFPIPFVLKDKIKYLAIQENNHTDFLKTYLPNEFYYNISDKYQLIYGIKNEGNDQPYGVFVPLKVSGSDFIAVIFGYGFTEEDIANAEEKMGTPMANSIDISFPVMKDSSLLYSLENNPQSEGYIKDNSDNLVQFYQTDKTTKRISYKFNKNINYIEFYQNGILLFSIDLNKENNNKTIVKTEENNYCALITSEDIKTAYFYTEEEDAKILMLGWIT